MFGTEYSRAFPPAHNYLYGVGKKKEKLREKRREKEEEEEEEGIRGKGLNSSVEWRRP